MTPIKILIAAFLFVVTGLVSGAEHASAATNMGSGVTCYGNPTYGTNPRITCTMNAYRYAAWIIRDRDPGNTAYCHVWVVYGDAFRWSNGNVTVNTRSWTYAGYQRC